MTSPLTISASVEIDAPPEQVWALVSDFVRMAQWSPECRRIIVLGKPTSGLGAQFVGVNKRGWAVWPTTSKIVTFEPARAIGWRTRESGATWTYELAASGTGTRLTGRRDLAGFSVGTKLMAPLIGGAAGHDEELTAGITTTLQRIKATVDSQSATSRAQH